MKKIIYSFGVCLMATQIQAQVYNNGAELFVSEGAVVSFNTDVVNDGKITNNGKIHFQKNFDNLSLLKSNGTVVFDGNSMQVLRSPKEVSFGQLLLDNDLKLETPLRVEGALSFRRGVIESSSQSPLIFSAGSRYDGASDFSHIKGVISKEGSESFEFPLGDGNNYRAFRVAGNHSNQTLTASYLYRSPLSISEKISENVDAINQNEYWTLKSESTRGSAKISLANGSDLDVIAFLDKGTWSISEDASLSATTDLANGTLFTRAKSRNIQPAIGVYPNPTDGEFFLKLSGMNETELITVDVVNQDGSRVLQKTGTVKELRKAYVLPEHLPATELTVRVVRGDSKKPLYQKMILNK
ncbi:hypothetical protein [Emticicia sp. TH156]|uniref:hypothetical protein n=1 Tax=Emticicia sp. TH156 TaxID=2067454 RepID=UPI000C7738AD|nr:hypothetical protein [Emticicia sp. TH156]PLK45987.1 hypothetical protein C0V77_01145 [Emticicia sp. TH156]